MSKAMQLVGIMLLGFFTLVIVNLMNDVRSTDELDYYMLQELTESSMYDAVDYSFYRSTGQIKVDRDLFLESFNRRFATTLDNVRDYHVKIIDFNETPPKVSIEITTRTLASVTDETAVLTTRVSGIIESIYDNFVMSRGAYGEATSDEDGPTIDVTRDGDYYVVTMKDDVAISEYCMYTLPKDKSGKFEISKITGGNCFNDVGNNTKELVRNFKYTDTSVASTDVRFVVVYDRAGHYAGMCLGDSIPFIESAAYSELYNQLDMVFKDDEEVSQYRILKEDDSILVDWKNVGKNTTDTDGYKKVSVVVKKDQLVPHLEVGKNVFKIQVKDNKGQLSVIKKMTIDYRKVNAPSIFVKGAGLGYDKNTKIFTVKFTDPDGDLAKYAISTSSCKNTAVWSGILSGNSQTIKQTINGGGIYYFCVIDNEGNVVEANSFINATYVSASRCDTHKFDVSVYYESLRDSKTETIEFIGHFNDSKTECVVDQCECKDYVYEERTEGDYRDCDGLVTDNRVYVCPDGFSASGDIREDTNCTRDSGGPRSYCDHNGADKSSGKCVWTATKNSCGSGKTDRNNRCEWDAEKSCDNGATVSSGCKKTNNCTGNPPSCHYSTEVNGKCYTAGSERTDCDAKSGEYCYYGDKGIPVANLCYSSGGYYVGGVCRRTRTDRCKDGKWVDGACRVEDTNGKTCDTGYTKQADGTCKKNGCDPTSTGNLVYSCSSGTKDGKVCYENYTYNCDGTDNGTSSSCSADIQYTCDNNGSVYYGSCIKKSIYVSGEEHHCVSGKFNVKTSICKDDGWKSCSYSITRFCNIEGSHLKSSDSILCTFN